MALPSIGARNSFEKKPLQSKKWLAMLIGVSTGMLVYIGALMMIALKPAQSADIVNLANTIVIYLGATVSFLIGGQSVVDWKNYSALESVTKTEIQNKNVNVNVRVSRQDSDLMKKYQDANKDDPSYAPLNSSDFANQDVWRHD